MTFLVNGRRVAVDRSAPFRATLRLKNARKRFRLVARVQLATGEQRARCGRTLVAASRYRRERKNARSSSAHSSASSPPATSGRWLSRGSASTSRTLPAAPAFGSVVAVDHARHAREHDRARAHRARLERHVEHAVEHPPRAELRGGLAQRQDLGVRGGVLAQLALVVAGPDDLAVLDHDGPDRDVVVLERALRLAQREPHEVLVAREEPGDGRSWWGTTLADNGR